MQVHIGTSGWSYDHWQGVLYPDGLAASDRLACFVQRFRTAELNSSYYHWPRDSTFASWRQRLPEGFVLSVKAPRPLTHAKRLYQPEQWLARVEAGLCRLGSRCGPLLVQTPPAFALDYPRLEYFLQQIPGNRRTAFEFRHPSWHQEAVFALLDRYGAAYCVMSGASLPCVLRATANFVYVRMHGPDTNFLYGGSYSDNDLRWWADRIREWRAQGREVFVYFNNDGGGNAVRNAESLRGFVGDEAW